MTPPRREDRTYAGLMTVASPQRTLASLFDPRSNSLNALRLVLAALVIVSHSWPLTGREPEPALGGANLGVWAVLGFFAISGFLITRSRLSGRPTHTFYRARALRILPAFLVCLVVVAFVFAPVSLLLDPDDSLWIGYFQAGISHLPAEDSTISKRQP